MFFVEWHQLQSYETASKLPHNHVRHVLVFFGFAQWPSDGANVHVKTWNGRRVLLLLLMNHYNRAHQRKRLMDRNSKRKSKLHWNKPKQWIQKHPTKRTTPKNFQSVWKNKPWHKANIAAIWDLMHFSCTCSSELFSLSLTICGFA